MKGRIEPTSSSEYVLSDIICPALYALHPTIPYSNAAAELLLGTALVESNLKYIVQINGPAVSIFQIEPRTLKDLFYYCKPRPYPDLLARLETITPISDPTSLTYACTYNQRLAAALARIYYWRIPQPIPSQGSLQLQAAYWKKYYNTALGKGTITAYVEAWMQAHS